MFEGFQTESEVLEICKEYDIIPYGFNLNNGLIDVDGDVNLNDINLSKFPLKFGEVTGYFKCNNNQLTSLEGAPHTVGGYFDCEHNKLTSLEGAPKSVGQNFWCHNNNIRSFEGLVNIKKLNLSIAISSPLIISKSLKKSIISESHLLPDVFIISHISEIGLPVQ